MDVKLLVVLMVPLVSACLAETDKHSITVPDNAFVPGVFIPTNVLELLKEHPKDDKEKSNPEIEKNSDQISTTLNSEQPNTLQYPQTGYVPNQNDRLVNQQPAIDQSRQIQPINTNIQGNPNQQPDNNQQNNLPNQLSGPVNPQQYPVQQQGHQVLTPQQSQQPNAYNFQPNGQQLNNFNNPPPNGYYQQPNVYNPQPNLYYAQPYVYSQQPNGYYQQPNSYNQQPNVYNQQTFGYNQQPYVYNQQPNIYNQQPLLVTQPNQALFIPNGQPTPVNPKLNGQPALIVGNPGLVLHPSQNEGNLYAMLPVAANSQNNLPNPNMNNNNAYFVPVHQVSSNPNTAVLMSSKVEED